MLRTSCTSINISNIELLSQLVARSSPQSRAATQRPRVAVLLFAHLREYPHGFRVISCQAEPILPERDLRTILYICRRSLTPWQKSTPEHKKGMAQGRMRQLLVGCVGMVLFLSIQSIINSRISSLDR